MCSSDAIKSLDPSNVIKNKAFSFDRVNKGFQASIDVIRGKDSFSDNKDVLRRGIQGSLSPGEVRFGGHVTQESRTRAEKRSKESAAKAATDAADAAERDRLGSPKQEAGEFVGEDLRTAQQQRRRRSRASSSILTSPLGVTTGGRTSILGG